MTTFNTTLGTTTFGATVYGTRGLLFYVQAGLLAVSDMLATWEERRALARLDAIRLRDLGLTRADVAAEVAKGFRRRGV